MRQFFKKNHMWLLAVVLFLSVTAATFGFLYSRGQFSGENPINGLNEARSHLPVVGRNYTLNYEQEEQYLREEENRKVRTPPSAQDIAPEAEQKKTQPIVAADAAVESKSSELDSQSEHSVIDQEPPSDDHTEHETGSGAEGEGNGGNHVDNNGGNVSEDGGDGTSKLPVITCSLTEGQVVSGAFLSFTVEAVSYQKEHLDAFDVKVTVNGNKLYSSGNQNGVISYRTSQELQNGSNEVAITATDTEGNTATKVYHIIVNPDGERPKGGTMRVTLRADSLGLGVVFDQQVTFYEGENLPYVIDRAFQQAGTTYSYTGSFDYGFYLQRVSQIGITDGFQIPDVIQKKLDEENCSWVGYEEDSIGEKDFYYWSGWIYRMDGYMPGGLSSVPAEDGSEVEILFTVHNGAEYDGTWFYGDW